MDVRERITAAVGSIRALAVLGGLFVALGAVEATLLENPPLASVLIDFVLIGGPGLVLLYAAYRLPQTDIDPGVFSRIVLWSLGGSMVMLGIVGLLVVNPGGSVDRPFRAAAIAAALGAAGGLPIGVNEARAITRAREAERRNRELERVQAELRNTIDRLEESNERLEQFAYAASHDLQEPLRMVSTYLQLIENRYGDELDEEGREYLEFAVDGADRMRNMVQGLLKYSRIETGGDSFEPVDLEDVLEDVLDDLQMKIQETDAEITADPLPRVEGDGDQLRQVLQNLLDNAIEYSGEEPPRVHVSADRDGNKWVVSVDDEGIGIDHDDADRVFEVFQRLHSQADHDGTGIGLALCERIVERHGGDIWIESERGAGTTFCFTLHPSRETDTRESRSVLRR